MNKFVKVNFTEEGTAEITYDIANASQLFTAMLAIEGIIGRVTGLGATEIREIIDDEKNNVEVKPLEEEIIDAEVDGIPDPYGGEKPFVPHENDGEEHD